ncbi:NAD kinase [Saprospiraceae bacterium]|jgi:NAD+ kinase|nr:NAD kinase [Saprospiraceae bacterium]MDA9873837.1 NAD kinase [Saprospiraceae bacterium]MDC1508588.1 NAD kinase [Saprospiraceae bacterium]HAV29983.1 NAD kinase [Saprospirales bacterium]HAW05808.1 NAD kinase [Saprospirales bacterium]|tara:strand:- start:81 stop:965 length:885 start_codon:yes stop_codon:yes gene_type:complete
MKNILLYGQTVKLTDTGIIKALLQKLEDSPLDYYIFDGYKLSLNEASIEYKDRSAINTKDDLETNAIDLIITLGGDGTILKATNLVQDLDIPIMGINMGRLGFLANIEKSKILSAVDTIIAGDFFTEERSMLSLQSNLPLFEDMPFALNDFTVHKRDTSSMITITVMVDDKYLNSYWADGLIFSTPTGSTGYSLSCGGPIISPDSGNIVITPIAPHNLNVRPIVISNDAEISIRVEGRSENFLCTMDSRYETITAEHKITLTKCPFRTKLAHLNGTDFMQTIREKMLWGLDKRN